MSDYDEMFAPEIPAEEVLLEGGPFPADVSSSEGLAALAQLINCGDDFCDEDDIVDGHGSKSGAITLLTLIISDVIDDDDVAPASLSEVMIPDLLDVYSRERKASPDNVAQNLKKALCQFAEA